jgi:hypothetical protein
MFRAKASRLCCRTLKMDAAGTSETLVPTYRKHTASFPHSQREDSSKDEILAPVCAALSCTSVRLGASRDLRYNGFREARIGIIVNGALKCPIRIQSVLPSRL